MSYSRAAKKTTFSNYTCLTDITSIFLKWSGSKERSLCRKLRLCFPISLLQISNCWKFSKGVSFFVHETCCTKMKMKELLANSTQHSSGWRNYYRLAHVILNSHFTLIFTRHILLQTSSLRSYILASVLMGECNTFKRHQFKEEDDGQSNLGWQHFFIVRYHLMPWKMFSCTVCYLLSPTPKAPRFQNYYQRRRNFNEILMVEFFSWLPILLLNPQGRIHEETLFVVFGNTVGMETVDDGKIHNRNRTSNNRLYFL